MTVHFNYLETLNTPEWKAKRLEIIERDKFCQRCDSIDKLEVHHIFYVYGVNVYDYPNNLLITLCRDCHQKETDYSKVLSNIIDYMKISGLLSDEIINTFFSHLDIEDYEDFDRFNRKIEETKAYYKHKLIIKP